MKDEPELRENLLTDRSRNLGTNLTFQNVASSESHLSGDISNFFFSSTTNGEAFNSVEGTSNLVSHCMTFRKGACASLLSFANRGKNSNFYVQILGLLRFTAAGKITVAAGSYNHSVKLQRMRGL